MVTSRFGTSTQGGYLSFRTFTIGLIWTSRLIHTIRGPTDAGTITCLQPSPVHSLLAIAYGSGQINIHDILRDTVVMSLNEDKNIKNETTTSISFRTDGLGAGSDGTNAGVMVTAGTESGDLTFWDLNEGGRVSGVLRGAHSPPNPHSTRLSGGITKAEFLPSQPVVVTTGADNALKTWLFDETPFSSVPRPLHARLGHASPVTTLSFLPTDFDGADKGEKWLLSGAQDRSLWAWSLRRDGQSSEISQGAIRKKAKKLGILAAGVTATSHGPSIEELKANEITCMSCSLNRDGGMGGGLRLNDASIWTKVSQKNHPSSKISGAEAVGASWESVLTGHKGDRFARTWFWGRRRAGRWAFETSDGGTVSSVCVTACGSFGLVGSSKGGIDLFNLQSGHHRKSFPAKIGHAHAKKLKKQGDGPKGLEAAIAAFLKMKHSNAVTGIEVDTLNRRVISTGLDGKIKFWDFATGQLLHQIELSADTAICKIVYYRASDLIAVSGSDCLIRLVDVDTMKFVRILSGARGEITDFSFSPDGRWITAASADGVIRTWDLPTGHLVDAIKFLKPCTALSFSGSGEFLATAHEDDIGISIWSNRAIFAHVATRRITEDEIHDVNQPTVSGEGGANMIDAAFEDENLPIPSDDDYASSVTTTLDQLDENMMTLSLQPRNRWQTLINLETIKQRNKPKEPPKKPEQAPFFLPSLTDAAALTNGASQQKTELTVSAAEVSRISKLDSTASRSHFTTLLREATHSNSYVKLLTHLASLPPASADIEIRSLSVQPPYTELIVFVRALTGRLRIRKDYELVQAWMKVFLKIHREVLAAIVADAAEDSVQQTVSHDDMDEDEPAILGAKDLQTALATWRNEQELARARLGELAGFCSGVVGFLRSARS
jgi:U3 small nucleolar RNA-associated protein 21